MQYKFITSILGIQGFKVVHIEQAKHKGYNVVVLHLEHTHSSYKCSGCGQVIQAGYQ